MKKRMKFDITKYNSECKLRQVNFKKHARMVVHHPAFWLFAIIVITYSCGL